MLIDRLRVEGQRLGEESLEVVRPKLNRVLELNYHEREEVGQEFLKELDGKTCLRLYSRFGLTS